MCLDKEILKKLLMTKEKYVEGLSELLKRRYDGAKMCLRGVPKTSVEDVEATKSALLCDEPPSFPGHEIE